VSRPLLLTALVLLCGCHLVLELDRPTADTREPVDGASADERTEAGPQDGPRADLSLCAWPHRRRLTFDNTLQTQDLKRFPVLVVLDPAHFDYADAAPDGRDLRFVDADGQTPLPHEIERWDAAGKSQIWVRVPQIDGGSATDHIWLYHGNPSAQDAQDPPAVWSEGYEAVWHLGQPPATTDSLLDSTGRYHASPQGSGGMLVPGWIGDALAFDGFGYLTATLAQAPVDLTYEAWFRIDAHNPGWEHHLVELRYTQFHVDENLKLEAGTGNEFDAAETQCKTAVTVGTWHHAAFAQSKSGWALFLDGKPEAQGPEIVDPGVEAYIGAIYNTATMYDENARMHGVIDEPRISSVPRSAGWIAAQHASMTDRFVTISAAQPAAGAPCPP
jgi:biopolymer transport protein ExbB